MNPVATFEDILAILEQNPQLRDALRNYVLDEELRQLPAVVRQLDAKLTQFMEQQAEITAAIWAGIDSLNATLNNFMEQTNALLADHSERMARQESDIGELKTDVAGLKRDMSVVKGQLTPLAARRMMGKIADVTQCRRPRWLDEHDVIDIADDADTSNVPANELESFRAIDLVMRGIDRNSPTGEQQYIVIECSATVASNDIARAKRNAGYMEQFTGVPTKAVVIGNEIPDGIAELAQRESVHCIVITNKGARPR